MQRFNSATTKDSGASTKPLSAAMLDNDSSDIQHYDREEDLMDHAESKGKYEVSQIT